MIPKYDPRKLFLIPQILPMDPDPIVKLSVLQQFARDTRTLLRAHQGRLALNMFEAAYAQHFGVSLVAASYGYPSTAALLQAIPHMATIRGKGFRRTVLLSQDFHFRNGNRIIRYSHLQGFRECIG